MEEIVFKAEPKHHIVLKVMLSIFGIVVVGTVLLVIFNGSVAPQALTNSQLFTDEMKESVRLNTLDGIVLPPEPDPTTNDATLAGVDSNNSGVRDDVELMIAQSVSEPDTFVNAISLAKGYQAILVAPTFNQVVYDVEYLRILCAAAKVPSTFDDVAVLNATINTEVRSERYKERISSVSGRFYDEESECKAEPEVSEVINGISVPPEPDPTINDARSLR